MLTLLFNHFTVNLSVSLQYGNRQKRQTLRTDSMKNDGQTEETDTKDGQYEE